MTRPSNSGHGAAWVIDPGPGPGARLASGLGASGRTVLRISGGPAGAASDLAARFDSRSAIVEALRGAEAQTGAPGLIVYCDVPAECLQPQDFATIGVGRWHGTFQAALRRSLWVLQAAAEVLAGRPAALVMVGPSLSLVGAAGLVPLSALAEGQRALVKSAARQLGARKLRLNWLALSPAVFAPQLAGAELPQVPELGPPPLPLGRVPDLEHDAAAALDFLGSAAGSALTGATLNLDGGEWMLP